MTSAQRSRALLLTAGLVALVGLLWHTTGDDRAVALGGQATLAQLVTALAGLVVVLALGWLALLVALIALEPAAGRRLTGWAGCPPALRRALLVLCGVAAAGALAVPAQAAGDDSPTPGQPTGTSALLDGLPMPERPTGRAPGSPAPSATPAPRVDAGEPVAATDRTEGHRTVRPGDTLWDIADRRLGGDADPSSVARAWQRIYAANRDVVGTDPDLIHPGTDLRVPPSVQEDQP